MKSVGHLSPLMDFINTACVTQEIRRPLVRLAGDRLLSGELKRCVDSLIRTISGNEKSQNISKLVSSINYFKFIRISGNTKSN